MLKQESISRADSVQGGKIFTGVGETECLAHLEVVAVEAAVDNQKLAANTGRQWVEENSVVDISTHDETRWFAAIPWQVSPGAIV